MCKHLVWGHDKTAVGIRPSHCDRQEPVWGTAMPEGKPMRSGQGCRCVEDSLETPFSGFQPLLQILHRCANNTIACGLTER